MHPFIYILGTRETFTLGFHFARTTSSSSFLEKFLLRVFAPPRFATAPPRIRYRRTFTPPTHCATAELRPSTAIRVFVCPDSALATAFAAMSSPSESVSIPNPEETWRKSTVMEEDLEKMGEDLVLLEKDIIEW